MLRSAAQDTGTATADGLVKDTTTQTFVKDVIEDSKRQPVLVDFWAEWCGPCKQLGPVLEKLVRAAKGKVKLVKMDIDKHPTVSGQLGIQSIPAVFAFVNGQPIDGFLGALPESQVTAFIERVTKDRIGGEEKDLLKAADDALANGDAAGAAELYAGVLAQDSSNVAALAGLARSYVRTGALEQAKQTLALVPEAKRNEAAVAAAGRHGCFKQTGLTTIVSGRRPWPGRLDPRPRKIAPAVCARRLRSICGRGARSR